MEIIIIIAIAVVVLIVTLAAILNRYKRCPSDKILVIYGKTRRNKNGGSSSAKCIHGGAAFIWPVFQSYSFLDLTPISIECNLTNALSKQNIRVDVPCRFTVGISTEPENMTNAAERLLGLTIENIQNIATDILFGQLRLVIATMDIEEINSDRDKFLANVSTNVEAELRKIGLKLINVNVTDIRDESGYIEALGKEAAAKAINDAKKSVAEQNRFGEIGKAEADRDKDIRIAETVRDTRISTRTSYRSLWRRVLLCLVICCQKFLGQFIILRIHLHFHAVNRSIDRRIRGCLPENFCMNAVCIEHSGCYLRAHRVGELCDCLEFLFHDFSSFRYIFVFSSVVYTRYTPVSRQTDCVGRFPDRRLLGWCLSGDPQARSRPACG